MGVIFLFIHNNNMMQSETDDDATQDIVLGHHSDEIHSVFRCTKWMTVAFVVICIGIIVLCVLI